MDVCDHDFHLVAQRKCVTLSDDQTYCPTAFGVRNPKTEDLIQYQHHAAVEEHVSHYHGRQGDF